MKLYLFQGGILNSEKHHFMLNHKQGVPFRCPVPYMLLDHPKGKVLIDTGMALEVVDQDVAHLGQEIVAAYHPEMTEAQWCRNAIRKTGVAADEIRYVILSHLHYDHAGCLGYFPNAHYVVQRKELHFAYVPDRYMKNGYVRKDFDKDLDWFFLEGWNDNPFDLFGDGTVKIIFTPGHTPGHQSVMINMPKSGPVFYAGDACYTEENLAKDLLPGIMWSPSETMRTADRIKYFRDELGAVVIFSHDPEAWQSYRIFPKDFYE